jgi:hypothetical protein
MSERTELIVLAIVIPLAIGFLCWCGNVIFGS